MNAFAAANDVLFADPHIASDALWLAGGAGPGVAVRVIRSAPDVLAPFGEVRIVGDSALFAVRVAEVPAPRRKDVIRVGGASYLVGSAPRRDAMGLNWMVEADPQ